MATKQIACPRCEGLLEQRVTKKWDVVLACLGECGQIWSGFDLNLMLDRPKK
jgi:hypothetical protein